MNNKGFLFVLIAIFCLPNLSYSQLRQKGIPLGLTENFLETYADRTMPAIRIPLYDRSEFLSLQKKYPDFVLDGIGTDVQINLQNEGEWILLPNGDRLWRLKIMVRGSESLTFLYDDFWLPKGAQFYLYSENESEVLGAFTSENNKPSGQFSTATIYDDVVYLEYREPMQVAGKGRISINKIMQKPMGISRSGGEFGFGASSLCHVNVNCTQGQSLRQQKRGVARIVMFLEGAEGTFLGYCTGTLMNNTAQDQTPYLLTAYHCVVEGFTPLYDQWQFDFGYESSNCTNPINEPVTRTIVGCEQVSGRQESDFLLLKLTNEVPSSFNPYYCGWKVTSNELPTNSKMISHPCGDVKKVSVDNRNTALLHPAPINWAEYTSSPNTHIRVEFDEGFSQLGGSGAPLFGEDGLIYGQLHGGNVDTTTCMVNRLFYGDLTESYDRRNNPTAQLKRWLNPTDEDITQLGGFDPFISEMAQFTGTISTSDGEGVGEVSVAFVSVDTAVVATTGIDGTFSTTLPRTTDYVVRFSKDIGISNGVTTFDLVRIRQHVLGAVLFDNPLQSLAADVNLSNSVTTFDIVEIRKAILGVYEVFPQAPSWGFVSPDGTLFNLFTLNDISEQVNFNVTAIKMGDVNFSADPSR